MKLFEDWVTVLPLREDESLGSKIVVPNKKLSMCLGQVREVGPGKFDHGTFVPTTAKPLDQVLYFRTGATEIEGSDLLLMRESNIIGILESEK